MVCQGAHRCWSCASGRKLYKGRHHTQYRFKTMDIHPQILYGSMNTEGASNLQLIGRISHHVEVPT